MKRNFAKLLFGPYFAAALFPPMVFANEAFGCGLWPWFLILCVLCTVQFALGLFFGGKRLLPGLALALITAGGVFAAVPGTIAPKILMAAFFLIGQLYALWVCAKPWEDLASSRFMVPTLVLNLLIAFTMFFGEYHDQVLLGWVAVPYLLVALMLTNRRTLLSNASMRSGLNYRIVQQNTVMMILFIALLLLLINFNAIAGLTAELMRKFVLLILWLMSLFGGRGSESGGGDGGGGGTPDLSGLGEAKSSAFWDILSVIVQYLVVIVVIVGGVILLYLGIRRFSRFLSGTLRRFVDAYQDGFEDEFQSLKTAEQMREEIVSNVSERLKKLFTPAPNWEKLSPAERVRYAYSRTRQRARAVGVDPDPLTPAELLGNKRVTVDGQRELFEQSYYQTRYAGATPDENEQANAKAVAYTRK